MTKENFIIHHYSPENRTEKGTVTRTIVFRNADDPYMICKKEVEELYNKACRLLHTVETWMTYSVDDDITDETIQVLFVNLNKIICSIEKEVETLITTHEVTDRRDLFELRDVVVQLQEKANALFNTYITQ